MPNAANVTPKAWSEIIVLFDNSEYSAIWGRRDDSKTRGLGVRWNGEPKSPKGYPNQGKYSLWYSEPEFLFRSILENLLALTTNNEYQANIRLALIEFESSNSS